MKNTAGAMTMLKGYEGNIPYMYLDSRGFVTVGVGFLLSTAEAAANFTFWKDSSAVSHTTHSLIADVPSVSTLVAKGLGISVPNPKNTGGFAIPPKATSDEIKKEWTIIKGKPPNHTATYYQPFTTLKMLQSDIDSQLTKQIYHFEGVARHTFTGWDGFASPAQLALLDMIYNLGSLRDFSELVSAAKQRDWTTCATLCHRRGPGNQRNDDTRKRFLDAAKEQPFRVSPATRVRS